MKQTACVVGTFRRTIKLLCRFSQDMYTPIVLDEVSQASPKINHQNEIIVIKSPCDNAASVSHVSCDENQAQHHLWVSLMQSENYRMVLENQVAPRIIAVYLVLIPIHRLQQKRVVVMRSACE